MHLGPSRGARESCCARRSRSLTFWKENKPTTVSRLKEGG